jgi:hypothetical protein
MIIHHTYGSNSVQKSTRIPIAHDQMMGISRKWQDAPHEASKWAKNIRSVASDINVLAGFNNDHDRDGISVHNVLAMLHGAPASFLSSTPSA